MNQFSDVSDQNRLHEAVAVSADSKPAVELRNVSKAFGGTIALDDVSLSIRKGEFFSLLGPSGCGKSTTLNIVGGFEDATRGEVLIDGRSVAAIPAYERPVNTVFQSYALFPHISVADNVEFGLRMKGVARDERRRAAIDMLKMVSLAGLEDRKPAQLSGGQRQRVALARALVNRPSVLLLDEPLGALDLKLRKQMQTELTRLQRQVGITFIYVTHDQEEAMAMSDRIAVMNRGRLLQVGTPSEIYEQPAHRFVMEFIGAANVLDGKLLRQQGDIAEMDLAGCGAVKGRPDMAYAPGSKVTLLVRPEKVRVAAGNTGSKNNQLSGQVTHIARLGFITHYTVRLPTGQDILAYRLNDATQAGAERMQEGQPAWLTWDEHDARIFAADSPSDSH